MPSFTRNFFSNTPVTKTGSNQFRRYKSGLFNLAKTWKTGFDRSLSALLAPGLLRTKLFLSAVVCTLCWSCFGSRDLQGELVYATLVKVQEVNRYPNIKMQVLTWETAKSVSFVTFEPSDEKIAIGTKARVLVFK